MNILLLRWSAIAFVIGMFTVLSSGCVVTDDGYGYGYGYGGYGGVSIGLDYYEPFGAVYGGWEPGYRVGPFRDGYHRPNRDVDRRPDRGDHPPPPHTYKPAPESHSMPSIPSHPRSGREGWRR
jgi:hypothetical protein